MHPMQYLVPAWLQVEHEDFHLAQELQRAEREAQQAVVMQAGQQPSQQGQKNGRPSAKRKPEGRKRGKTTILSFLNKQ